MISDALRRLSKHSAIYALAPAVQKALGFVLLPLVTAYIGTTANYGVVEMSAVTLAIAGQLFGINLLHGMTRYYPEYGTEKEQGRLVTTCLLLLSATTGAALVAAVLLRERAAALLFGSSVYADALVVVAAILFLQTIGQVGLRWLQVLQRSLAYGVLTTLKTVVEIGLKIWFLVGLGLTFMGVLYSVLGGEALVAAGMFIWIARRLGLGFSWPMAKRLIRYSYPLVLGGLAMFALHQADRWFVLRHQGEDGVGLYGLAYKLGSMANAVFLEAFGLIWFPYIFAVKDAEASRAISRAVLTYFTVLMCCVSLALAVFSPEVVRLMADEKFFESHRAMPLIAGGYVFWAVYQIVHTAFYLRERTGFVLVLVAGAAVLNLGLNALLVPAHGYFGAAWATFATFAVLAAAAWLLAERVMPVGYELGRVLVPFGLAAVLYGASRAVPSGGAFADALALPSGNLGGKSAGDLLVRALFVLGLPAGLWWGGYFRPHEKQEIRGLVRSLSAFARGRAR